MPTRFRTVTACLTVLFLFGGALALRSDPPGNERKGEPPPARPPTLRISASERWRLPLDHPYVGLPAVDAAGVVVTAGEAEVVAVDRNGTVQWRTALPGALARAPRIDGDRVFVAGRRAVTALDRGTGAVVWSAATADEDADDERVNRPLVHGDVVLATTRNGRLLGLDRATGARRWDGSIPTPSTAEPAMVDGVAAVVGIGEWFGVDVATGVTKWSGDIGLIGTSSPVAFQVGGDARFAVATDERLVAVDATTGAPVWTAEAEQSELFQVPVVAEDGAILVPDHWGRLTAFAPGDGKRLWSTIGADGVAEFGEPVSLGDRRVVLPLDVDGPRVASPKGAAALRPPATGHGVARLGDQLVVTTWMAKRNYVVSYALEPLPALGERSASR